MKNDILKYRYEPRNADGQETVAHYEHRHAVERRYKGPFGRSLRAMLEGWARYADEYKDRYESPVGDDGVLGPVWEHIGLSIIDLLNGETGGFDCGSIEQNIRETLKANGCEPKD